MNYNPSIKILLTMMTTLAYIEMILEKVSFDTNLFEKELTKAIKTLDKNDRNELFLWCEHQFGESKMELINQCFNIQKKLVA
jgi:hypothetical protein